MSISRKSSVIQIRPKVGMYGAFARLNYKPWFALAEFVDNAIQSFAANRRQLTRRGAPPSLNIQIFVEDERIRISDNACGIREEDFPRAFSPAHRPSDTSGLSEFGLGMKAAACWFARAWSVTTSALGDPIERTIRFNVPNIVTQELEVLEIEERPARAEDHYTHLILEDLNVQPRGRTITKIKSHLASIYRRFLGLGDVSIHYNGDPISYPEPAVLTLLRQGPGKWTEMPAERREGGWVLERWQQGQRGSHVASTRAMASRAVIKLSWK